MSRVQQCPAYVEAGGINPAGDLGNPPAYELQPTDRQQSYNEAPPSYDSLYGQLKHAKDASDGNVDFAKKSYGICCKSIIPIICTSIFWAISIANIAMGAVYLNDCSAERMIPIYLIVQGVFYSVKSILSITVHCRTKDNDDDDEGDGPSKTLSGIERIVDLFLFAWFIAGCVFIYRTHGNYQSIDSSLPDYCNNTLFQYAFWIVTLNYILVGLVILLCCCCVCIVCCTAFKANNSGGE